MSINVNNCQQHHSNRECFPHIFVTVKLGVGQQDTVMGTESEDITTGNSVGVASQCS